MVKIYGKSGVCIIKTPLLVECPGVATIKRLAGLVAGVSNLLVSLGHTGRRRVVLGCTLNTQILTKTDKQKKKRF